MRQKPIALDRLSEVAKIQSTEASNKIEGIVTTSTRIRQLVEEQTTPRNRDESEILGYRDVLNTIHESHDYIPVTPSYILQLHRDLLKHAGLSYGGNFKNTQNYISETRPDGTQIEKTKDAYYDMLAQSDIGWHEETNDPTPFIKYMLQMVLACYVEFEERVGMMNGKGRGSTAYDIVKAYMMGKIGKMTGVDVISACPSVGRSAVLGAIKKLIEEGLILKCGSGRSTYYVRADAVQE